MRRRRTCWKTSRNGTTTPTTIRDALTEDDIRATDKRARFVTVAAYEEAGGAVRRDLFAEDDEGVFLLDAALLDRLALEKLRSEAEQVKAEGWKWVEAALDVDRSEMDFRVRRPEPCPCRTRKPRSTSVFRKSTRSCLSKQRRAERGNLRTASTPSSPASRSWKTRESAYTPEVAGHCRSYRHARP